MSKKVSRRKRQQKKLEQKPEILVEEQKRSKFVVDSKKLNRIFLLLALASCICHIVSSSSTWLDMGYVNSLNLPPDGDTIMIPLYYGVVSSTFFASIAFVAYMFLAKRLKKWANVERIDSLALFGGLKNRLLSIFRYFLLAIAIGVVIWLLIPFYHVNLLADVSYLLFVILGAVAFLLFFTINFYIFDNKKPLKQASKTVKRGIFSKIIRVIGIVFGAAVYLIFILQIVSMIIASLIIALCEPFITF